MAWQLVRGLDLESASLSFDLPARTELQRGGPAGIAKVVTSAEHTATTLRLTLGQSIFRLTFEPNVVIDLPLPLGDMGLQSIEHELQTGVITPSLWHLPGLGVPVGREQAMDQARSWMRALVTSTSLAISPYDPSEDRELALSLQQVFTNLQGGADSVTALAHNIVVSAKIVVREAMAAEVGPGGFRIPADTVIQLRAELAGSPANMQESPQLSRLTVDCSSVVLRQGGEDQAEVKRFVLRRGGEVSVELVRPLGAPGQLAGLESLVRLVAALGTQGALGIGSTSIAPIAVEGLVKQEIEAILRPALLQWVRDNSETLAGIDLRTALDVA